MNELINDNERSSKQNESAEGQRILTRFLSPYGLLLSRFAPPTFSQYSLHLSFSAAIFFAPFFLEIHG